MVDKKAQIGATLSWMLATFVIIIILAVSFIATSALKGISSAKISSTGVWNPYDLLGEKTTTALFKLDYGRLLAAPIEKKDSNLFNQNMDEVLGYISKDPIYTSFPMGDLEFHMDPENPPAFCQWGVSWKSEGDWEESHTAWEEYVNLPFGVQKAVLKYKNDPPCCNVFSFAFKQNSEKINLRFFRVC